MTELPVAVVGGGFKGIVASHFLAAAGKPVLLIERSQYLGGILASFEERGLFLDYGCHVFENSDAAATDFVLKILGDAYVPVSFRYASITEGRLNEEIAAPDFRGAEPARRDRMAAELIAAAAQSAEEPPGQKRHSLADALRRRFGKSLSRALGPVVKKISTADAESLEASALNSLPLGRVRLLEDGPALMLKQLPEIDPLLAVPSQRAPMQFYPDAGHAFPHRIFYPAGRGMRTFGDKALDSLAANGVEVLSGESISALVRPSAGCGSLSLELTSGQSVPVSSIVWTLNSGGLGNLLCANVDLQRYIHKTPLVLFYFFTPSEDEPKYTYLHNFDADSIYFRVSSPGFYGQQKNTEGLSYLLVEAPTEIGSDLWADPESRVECVWQELRGLGMTSSVRPEHLCIRKIPGAYAYRKCGFTDAQNRLLSILTDTWPEILVLDKASFSKNQVFTDVVEALAQEFA